MNLILEGLPRQRLAATYRSRFKNILRVLSEVRESKKPFDIRFWDSPIQKAEHEGYYHDLNRFAPDCGTVRCAMGHCGHDPVFKSQGFSCKDEGIVFYPKTHLDKVVVPAHYYYGYPAVRIFLGIDKECVSALFDPECYTERELNDPDCVSKKISWFLANRVVDQSDHEFLMLTTGEAHVH